MKIFFYKNAESALKLSHELRRFSLALCRRIEMDRKMESLKIFFLLSKKIKIAISSHIVNISIKNIQKKCDWSSRCSHDCDSISRCAKSVTESKFYKRDGHASINERHSTIKNNFFIRKKKKLIHKLYSVFLVTLFRNEAHLENYAAVQEAIWKPKCKIWTDRERVFEELSLENQWNDNKRLIVPFSNVKHYERTTLNCRSWN